MGRVLWVVYANLSRCSDTRYGGVCLVVRTPCAFMPAIRKGSKSCARKSTSRAERLPFTAHRHSAQGSRAVCTASQVSMMGFDRVTACVVCVSAFVQISQAFFSWFWLGSACARRISAPESDGPEISITLPQKRWSVRERLWRLRQQIDRRQSARPLVKSN